MKKRLLNLFLVMLMVACVLPMAVSATQYAGETCDGFPAGSHSWINGSCRKCLLPCDHKFDNATGECTVCDVVCEHKEYNQGVCKTCNTRCEHDAYDDGFCSECGVKCAHVEYANGVCVDCKTPHEHETYVNGVCPECGGSCAHENWSYKSATTATCEDDGVSYGKECDDCGYVFFGRQVSPALGHNYNYENPVETVIKEATCTEEGKVSRKCSRCDVREEISVAKLSATGKHDYEFKNYKKGSEPTCTTGGFKIVKCKICGGTASRAAAALGHDYDYENPVETVVTKATCTENGVARRKCSRCTETKDFPIEKVSTTGKHDYKLDFWAVEGKVATCEDNAIGVFECSVCKDRENITVYAYGHDWDISVLKEATCTVEGMEFHQCKREGCGTYLYDYIDALGHNKVVVPAVEPTCTATGLTAGEKCDRCNQTFTAQSIVDKLAHAWEDVEAKDPTCEEDGYNAHRACANCDETDGMTVIPAGAAYHNYVNNKCTICEEYDPDHDHEGTGVVTTASTCTTEGVKTFECDGCDYAWTEAVAKAAHVYGADARCNACDALNPEHRHTYVQTGYTAPTCTAEGKATNRCSVCGDQTETLVNAIGHSYANGRCVNCGNPAACEHDNVSSTLTAATCSRAGREVFTCDDCGATVVDRTIAATGKHTYSNNYCTGCGKADPNKITVDKQGVYIVG